MHERDKWPKFCNLQNSVSYFWYCSMSYFLNCSAWKSAIYDREQVKKYDTEFCNLQSECAQDESSSEHSCDE